jgi:hypothetical protein
LEASAEEHAAGSGVAGRAGEEEDIEKPVYYGEQSTNSERGTSSSSSLSPAEPLNVKMAVTSPSPL